MSQPLVIYAGPMSFPQGGAAARRILGNAMSLIAAGFKVEVWSAQLAQAAQAAQAFVGGPTVRALGERTAEHLPRLARHAAYLGIGRGLIRALEAERRPIAAVILYSGYTPYLLRLLSWSRRSGTPVAFDAVEWYDPPHKARWLVDPYYWNTEFAMRRLAPRAGNAITISRRLEAHFTAGGCRTVRIPPTLDVEAVTPDLAERPPTRPLLLSYTGVPGHKDRLGPVIAALARLGPHAGVRLVAAGVTGQELLALRDVRSHGIRTLPGSVTAIGRVSHADALALTRRADFSILLRPRARFAEAGFPTKVAESLAVGTPVFGNLTGDLDCHLRDGETAVVLDSPGTEAVLYGLEHIKALSPAALAAMRTAARQEAEHAFDYRAYVPAVSRFIDNLATCHG